MDNISQIEDTCSYVGVYCVSSFEKILDSYWIGLNLFLIVITSKRNIIGCVIYVITVK